MHVGDERYRQDHSRCEKRGEGELPTVPMRKSCDGRRARHCFTRRRATAHTARLRHTYKSSIRLVKSCSRALKQALLLPLPPPPPPPPVAATQFFHLRRRKGWGLRHTITTKIVFHSGQQKNPFCPLAAFGSSATLPGACVGLVVTWHKKLPVQHDFMDFTRQGWCRSVIFWKPCFVQVQY